MDPDLRRSLDALDHGTRAEKDQAFAHLRAATSEPAPWATEAWDEVVTLLSHRDNRTRAIAAQVLCNLAQRSDPDARILDDFPALLHVTRDERFVTARHCMQSLWKVGVAGPAQRERLVAGLEERFHECATEKNCTLIRFDICVSLRKVYDETGDEQVREAAHRLMEKEDDAKYRKKYRGAWKDA
jgi:HEAT repeat protein